MKKITYTIIALMLILTTAKAQTTAMNFKKSDCNGTMHDLFADLDAGNAVVLHFYMPSCGSCPPPAQKIQQMANNIMGMYPGKVKAYAIPYNNTTTCTYSKSWCSSNGLSLFTPMDSGATQVAYYGGFGMPTVVLLGGTDHKVLFSTLSFSTSDTTIMRNEILALFGSTGIESVKKNTISFNIFPNPATDDLSISVDLKEMSTLQLEILDITGKQVVMLVNERLNGRLTRHFNTSALPSGYYVVRMKIDGETSLQKLTVVH